MKKYFYMLFFLLFIPFVVNAKEIEIKSITPEETYSDIAVEVKDSSTANINFTIDGTHFTKVAKYNVVIKNNTNNTYDFTFDNITSLKNMLIQSSQDKLNPGENTIKLTITRPELGAEFYTNTTSEDASSVLIKMTNPSTEEEDDNKNKTTEEEKDKKEEKEEKEENTTEEPKKEDKKEEKEDKKEDTKEKENPKTGYTIVKVLTVSIILISIAIAMYIKSKNSSSFFILLLLLFIPSMINAKETYSIKININTTVTKEFTTCVSGDTITEVGGIRIMGGGLTKKNLSINYSNLTLNTKEDNLLEKIFNTNTKLNKKNILSFVNNLDNSKTFEYGLIKEHLNYYDSDNYEFLDVNGEPNQAKALATSINTSDYTFLYKDEENTLTLYVLFPGSGIYLDDDEDSYKLNNLKIVFNKNNDDYVIYTKNNEYTDFGSVYCMGAQIGCTLSDLDNKNVPIINLKNYFNKLLKDSDKIIVNFDGTYKINNETIIEDNIKTYEFPKNYYYADIPSGDDTYKAIYNVEIAKVRDQEFQYNYLFLNKNNEQYSINADGIVTIHRQHMTTTTALRKAYIGDKYLVLVNASYGCYSLNEVS